MAVNRISILIAVVLVTAFAARAASYEVKGRILDLRGRPVFNAFVLVEGGRVNSVGDQLFIGAKTDRNGAFSLRKEARVGSVMYLHIAPPESDLGVNILDLPYTYPVLSNTRQLARMPVRFGKRAEIDIGSIKSDVTFTSVNVATANVLDQTADPFDTWLAVFDREDRLVAVSNFGSLGNKGAISLERTASIVLPKGRWRIRVCGNYDCRKALGESTFFEVRGREVNLALKLKSKYK